LEIINLKNKDMFDDLNNSQVKSGTAKPMAPAPVQLNARGENSPAAAVKPEDIFSEVDRADKPEVFRPRPDRLALPRGTVIPPETGWRSNKKMVFGLLFGGLAVVVAGGYLGLKLAVKGYSADNNTATKEQPANIQPVNVQVQPEAPPAGAEVNNQSVNNAFVEPIPPAVTIPLDSDNDGLTDQTEANLGTDANNPDTDGDGLTDREEVNVYKTNSLNADTDGDGYKDGDEVNNGYNPRGAGKLLEIK